MEPDTAPSMSSGVSTIETPEQKLRKFFTALAEAFQRHPIANEVFSEIFAPDKDALSIIIDNMSIDAVIRVVADHFDISDILSELNDLDDGVLFGYVTDNMRDDIESYVNDQGCFSVSLSGC